MKLPRLPFQNVSCCLETQLIFVWLLYPLTLWNSFISFGSFLWYYIQMVPDSGWLDLDFLTLRWCESDTHSGEAVFQILSLIFSWVSDMPYDTPSWCWAAAASHSSRRPHVPLGKQLITQCSTLQRGASF